jgi:hypothetical protein
LTARRKYASPSSGRKNVRIVKSRLNAKKAPLRRSKRAYEPLDCGASRTLVDNGASRRSCAIARYSALDDTLNSEPCLSQCESSPRCDANPMRRSRGSVRFDDDDELDAEEEARVDWVCASARGDDRRLLIVGTSTAASVMASDTRLTRRRCERDPRRDITPSVGLGRAPPRLPSSLCDFCIRFDRRPS